MKKLFVLCLALLALLVASCDTGVNGDYLDTGEASETELAVITEMNYARTDPKGYVTDRLKPLVASSTGSYLSALKECIDQMNGMSAVGKLSFGNGLYIAAREWVQKQGVGTEIGHDSKLYDRIKKYCSYTTAGENLAYGYSTAKDIVIALLVDDGVADRGHRKNILDGSFTHAGAAIGSHAEYDVMCCIDYAGGYSED